jgi:Rps23 Pro-64 3,4-dihydroxylase Tpa1-like proline 4-hydroxylase
MLPIKYDKRLDYMVEFDSCANHLRTKVSEIKASVPSFLDQRPFPYVIIDDALPVDFAEEIEAYGRELKELDENHHLNSRKYANNRIWEFEENVRTKLSWLYSAQFEKIIEELTNIPKLHSDPEFNVGGGYHLLPNGGFLNIHKDFNYHPSIEGYFRRLNFILYLNKNWTEDMGGELQLVDKSEPQNTRSVVPLFNRAVIFETNSSAWHGNPTPVNNPTMERLSFATFYYTLDRSHCGQEENRSTLYTDSKGQITNRIRNAALPFKRLVPNVVWEKARKFMSK